MFFPPLSGCAVIFFKGAADGEHNQSDYHRDQEYDPGLGGRQTPQSEIFEAVLIDHHIDKVGHTVRGDQPQAIETLVKGFKEGNQFETLLGVTGSADCRGPRPAYIESGRWSQC